MIEILKDFEKHLLEDGKRPKTVESYVGDLKGLMEYLGEMNVTFDGSLSRFYVTSYKNKLLERDYEPTTINKKNNSLHSFNHYLIRKGYMSEVVNNSRRDRAKVVNGSEKAVEVYDEGLINKIHFY